MWFSQRLLQGPSGPYFSCVLNNSLPLRCLQLNFPKNSVVFLVDSCSFLLKSDTFLFPLPMPTGPEGTHPSVFTLNPFSFVNSWRLFLSILKGNKAFTEVMAWLGGL